MTWMNRALALLVTAAALVLVPAAGQADDKGHKGHKGHKNHGHYNGAEYVAPFLRIIDQIVRLSAYETHLKHQEKRYKYDKSRKHGHGYGYDPGYGNPYGHHGPYYHKPYKKKRHRPYYGDPYYGKPYKKKRHHKKHHGHGPYGYGKACHPVSKSDYWHGRYAKIGGTMCYDHYGYGYVVPGSRYVIHYY